MIVLCDHKVGSRQCGATGMYTCSICGELFKAGPNTDADYKRLGIVPYSAFDHARKQTDAKIEKMKVTKPRVISEPEFAEKIKIVLNDMMEHVLIRSVTGPGRSGAVASVYASHILSVPFIPYGQTIPKHLYPVLVIDTAHETGKTLRKATRRYAYADSMGVALYNEPPRVMFWYESPKPQRYQHERKCNVNHP